MNDACAYCGNSKEMQLASVSICMGGCDMLCNSCENCWKGISHLQKHLKSICKTEHRSISLV